MKNKTFIIATAILISSALSRAEFSGSSRLSADTTRCSADGTRSNAEIVQVLAERVRGEQFQKDEPYVFPSVWEKKRGLYASEIRMNTVGPPDLARVRHNIAVIDNNMHGTGWVTTCLLEAYHYGKSPKPTDRQMSMALELLGKSSDRNIKCNHSLHVFREQVYNEKTQYWGTPHDNIEKSLVLLASLPPSLTENFLKLLDFTDVWDVLIRITSGRPKPIPSIPADFDDTFINLGVGALLAELRDDLPDAFAKWSSDNRNLTSVVDALRRYAYRPFSSDHNANTVDARAYYYLRYFLKGPKERGEDIALAPVWAYSLDETRKSYPKGVSMSFNVQEMDVAVAAIAMYGLTGNVLSGLLPSDTFEEPQIAQIYINTTSWLADILANHMYERPDLMLTYYPCYYELYWLMTRILHRLDTANLTGPLSQIMQHAYDTLRPVLEKEITSELISKAQAVGPDMVYWDDFIGNADYDKNNNTLVKGEDRLFTTSMVLNALMNTWTVFSKADRTNSWKKGAPEQVKSLVAKGVKFLNTYILTDVYKPWNSYTAMSANGRTSWPYQYPANRIEYLNGTALTDDQPLPKEPFSHGMQGYVPEAQYMQMLGVKHFEVSTPTSFTYNEPGDFFLMFSCDALTWASAMTALSRFDNTVDTA